MTPQTTKLIILCLFGVLPRLALGGQIYTWVEKNPAFINNSPADHTYLCTNKVAQSNRNEKCYAYHGGSSPGGDYLSGTMGTGDEQKTLCLASTPAKCSVTYIIEGVCHQEANRGLFAGSKKLVNAARGYQMFARLYGPYGKNKVKWDACRATCGV